MIYKQCVLTISNNTATLDEDIYLYRLDKNVELYFTIVNNKYKFDKSDLNNIINATNASYFQMRLYKNTEVKYTFAIQPTDDGQAILTITDDLIDEPIEVGDYDFQISLLDADKSSMISMPIARQQLHVCEPLVTDSSGTGTAILGLSTLDSTGEIVDAFDEQGNYIRQIHVNGELISAELFNKWETALDTNSSSIKTLDSQYKDIANLINENYLILKSPNGTQYKVKVADNGTLEVIGVSEEGLEGLIENRILVWHDEFNGNSLDTNNWNYELGVVRHNEPQYYRRENVTVENSNLILKAKRENFKDRKWTSGSIHTNNKAEFRNGRFEAKMKLSSNISSFPAFWLYGAIENEVYTDEDGTLVGIPGCHFPRCGEIDIVEHINNYIQVGGYYNNSWDITDDNEMDYTATAKMKKQDSTIDFSQYHIYALEKTQTKLKFYFDDTLLLEVPITEENKIFRDPYFIILDHALMNVDSIESSLNEIDIMVDWVRVYAPTEDTFKILANSIKINEENILLNVGDMKLLTTTFLPENTQNQTLIWKSSNDSIATVEGGCIRAKAVGNCKATVTTSNGKKDEIDIIVKALSDICTITNNLTGCNNSNTATKIEKNGTYTATLTPEEYYILDSVTITMGGTDITNSAYNEGNINITNVTGNIIITAIATNNSPYKDYDIYLDATNHGSDDNIWKDLSGNGNNVILESFTHDNTTNGWINNKLIFDGVSTYGICSKFKPFETISDFECEIVFNFITLPTNPYYVLGLINNSDNTGYKISGYSGGLIVETALGSTTRIKEDTSLSLNLTYSIKLAVQNGRATLIYNGTTITKDITVEKTTNQPLYLGANKEGNTIKYFANIAISKFTFRKL